MIIPASNIGELNDLHQQNHTIQYANLKNDLELKGIDPEALVKQLIDYQVAIPSWALGAGGTRFARFSIGGEPSTLEEKIKDVGLLHQLTQSAGSISLHIPWDIPEDPLATKELASSYFLAFDAVNSNTFQDQSGQRHSYKFGSLCHQNPTVREQAINHNIEVIEIGKKLGSQALTVWLADGSSFPGQHNFRKALDRTAKSLQSIYQYIPEDWAMLIEYKPYEPYFYSMVIPDWGTSLLLANQLGDQAYTLVDLGHHLPNTNIEQIVATLHSQGKLGGFHFNDSKYSDDDLSVGSIKPYQLFLIFNELVFGIDHNPQNNPDIAWMIDASHNLKDPLEDLMQSLDQIMIAYAKALLVNQSTLAEAQALNDITFCQFILNEAYQTDVRPLVRESRLRNGGALYPVEVYRKLGVRDQLIKERGKESKASGL